MAEEENKELEVEQKQAEAGEHGRKKASEGSVFEGIYDQLPDISVRSLDRFILLCVITLIAVILFGVLKANNVF